jgi:hypothetical protein
MYRHSFPGELDSVRMPELMWGEAVAHACLGGELSQFIARGSCRPSTPAGRSIDDAEQRSGRQRHAVGQPFGELLEPELVHPGLAALVALPVTDQQRTASLVDVGLVERERFRDRTPPRQSTAIRARIRQP